jgi:hypothetical protein
VTPASIFKFTPLFTFTGPVRLYGLFAFVHVASELIMPVTSVDALTLLKCAVLTKINPLIIIATKNKLGSDLFFTIIPLTRVRSVFYKKGFCKDSLTQYFLTKQAFMSQGFLTKPQHI